MRPGQWLHEERKMRDVASVCVSELSAHVQENPSSVRTLPAQVCKSQWGIFWVGLAQNPELQDHTSAPRAGPQTHVHQPISHHTVLLVAFWFLQVEISDVTTQGSAMRKSLLLWCGSVISFSRSRMTSRQLSEMLRYHIFWEYLVVEFASALPLSSLPTHDLLEPRSGLQVPRELCEFTPGKNSTWVTLTGWYICLLL